MPPRTISRGSCVTQACSRRRQQIGNDHTQSRSTSIQSKKVAARQRFIAHRAASASATPLRTRHLSIRRFTAEIGDDEAVLDVRGAHIFALTADLSPPLQPGPTITTRVTLSFHSVHEPWWPRNLTDALSDFADLWLRRLEEQAYATAQHRQPCRS